MITESNQPIPPEAEATEPNVRGLDHGPLYTETPLEIREHSPYHGWIAEPWNAGTAFLFVLIALFWMWRLKGQYRRFPFLTMALPLLFAGGVGGTLYHGLRNWVGFFLLDLVPIYLLGVAASLYLWLRLGPNLRNLFGMLALLVGFQALGRWKFPPHWSINISYAALALIILSPILVALWRTNFRHVGWVAAALVSFGIAWICRLADAWQPPLLPMGTHWLWHGFGALTTWCVTEYLYHIAMIDLKSSRRENIASSQ